MGQMEFGWKDEDRPKMVSDGSRPERSSRNRDFTIAQKQDMASKYQEGISQRQIAIEYETSIPAIGRCLRHLGIEMRNTSEVNRIYSIDESAFDVITEASGYWLGFLMADGCIVQDGNSWQVRLSLASKDAGHVDAFRQFLGCDVPLRTEPANRSKTMNSGEATSFRVNSVRLAESLMRYGLGPRKSLTAKVIGLEDDHHFWRGMIDGDGWVSTIDGRPDLGLTGGRDIIDQYIAFASARIPDLTNRIAKNGPIFTLRLHGAKAMRMIEILYAGCSIALPRKREVAASWLANPFKVPYFDGAEARLAELDNLFRDLGSWTAVAAHLGTKPNRISCIRKIMNRDD